MAVKPSAPQPSAPQPSAPQPSDADARAAAEARAAEAKAAEAKAAEAKAAEAKAAEAKAAEAQAAEATGAGAHRVQWSGRRGRLPRKLRFTLAGWVYTGLTLAIGGGAINTGNNLMFLVLGLLLAGIVLSGVLSESTLYGLQVERALPREARAGRAALVGLRLTNTRGRIGSFLVRLRDLTDQGEAGRALVLRLDPGRTREAAYRWTPARRGLVVFERVEVSTRFPFGLFEKTAEVELGAAFVVFPREVPAPASGTRRSAPPGEQPERRAGGGTEFFGLRDAHAHDDARHIHWATSARRGHPVVVERERERARRVAVLVDNRLAGADAAERLDRAVETAAAIAHRARVEGSEVAFAASGVAVAPGSGAGHERRILHALALLEAVADGPAPATFARADVQRVATSAAQPAQPRAGEDA